MANRRFIFVDARRRWCHTPHATIREAISCPKVGERTNGCIVRSR
ncbi:hypothetical protein M7I_3527 [Glarea lozoyensis 74030]|uniref:Uncharacterized protein n=1 Tax=Glarea lozoyensis (strain ATCC 74030 / MF5533) TaxID=1104152 RepID=H0ELQ8_GLAL7|nr:hypothetical protein M7I_3527 [Glarea lozoyensis 74030]